MRRSAVPRGADVSSARPRDSAAFAAHERTRRPLPFLALIVCLTACGHLVEVQDKDTLYFGTNRPGGVVSEAEWRTFVDQVITPRFDGFTEWPSEGHWKTEREAGHVVEIIHPHRGANDAKIHEIIAEYKRRFQQESVLLVREHALATFQ